jgi:uncharacterized protein with ACT and thioredoxin-like domain
VQEISIVSRSTPSVVRPDGSAFVFLEFEGLRESRTIVDKLTRVRVTLPLAETTRLQELLAQRVTPRAE